ncbi:PEP-CTERM sorting domain-containing protein [Pirellulales bacterium]|nr:PEP-CTERM sorting domain-containing protein [Pirellulales bacterium]
MFRRSNVLLLAATLTLFAISHSGYAQTVYDADTTISTPTVDPGFAVTMGATLTVTTGGELSTNGASGTIGTADGFGTLLIEGSGVVDVEVGFPSNLNIGDEFVPLGPNGELSAITVREQGTLNVGNAFILGSRSPAVINLSDSGVINVGVNGPPSDEFRVGWLGDLCPEEGCDPPRTVEINQTGGIFNASPVRPVFIRFNTDQLESLDWNLSGGVIRFSGDRQDVVNEEWFNALAEIDVSYDIGNDITTIAVVDGLPCDATGDDVCDTDDLQILLDNFLLTDPPPTRLEGNFNFDSTVDHQDFVIWREEFLAGGGSLAEIAAFLDGSPVPEPSTLWLMGISGVALVARFRQRHVLSRRNTVEKKSNAT